MARVHRPTRFAGSSSALGKKKGTGEKTRRGGTENRYHTTKSPRKNRGVVKHSRHLTSTSTTESRKETEMALHDWGQRLRGTLFKRKELGKEAARKG